MPRQLIAGNLGRTKVRGSSGESKDTEIARSKRKESEGVWHSGTAPSFAPGSRFLQTHIMAAFGGNKVYDRKQIAA
jgi:hypothetical protein